jgi:PAS domain S-box-containing protein
MWGMATPGRRHSVPRSLEGCAALNDAFFRTLFDTLPIPAYIWQRSGADYRLVALNRAAAGLSMSRTRDFLGRTARELHRESNHDLHSNLALAGELGRIVETEEDHQYMGTAHVRRLTTTFVPLFEDIVVVYTDDITERRAMEQALRRSERMYRTIVDSAHEGIWTIDREGVTTYVNSRMAAMLGYEPSEMLNRPGIDFVPTELRDDALALRERHQQGIAEHFDFRLAHKDGSELWVSVASSPILDEEGLVTGAAYLVADISERKATEMALRASDNRVRALLDANPDLIVRVAGDGRYLDVHTNDNRVKQLLPLPPREFIGRTVTEVFGEEFARQHEHYRQRALATGRLQRWEYVRNVNDKSHYIEARFVKSAEDEVVVTARDITDRVQLEREVISSADRERARIGHDLHDGLAQLLTGVKLMLEALKVKLATEGSQHTKDAMRASGLVSRAIRQAGELAAGLSPIRKGGQLGEALEQLAESAASLFGAPVRIVANEPLVKLDEQTAAQLYRIAQEAVSNAAKHGKASRIELRCERRKGKLVLSVADDGVGISDTTESDGMGMHIMKYRAHSIGAELTITSRPEGGALVRCSYPLPDRSVVTSAPSTTSREPRRRPRAPGVRRRPR